MENSSEVVCIHVGQAGIQMGEATWELLAAEHGISCDGTWKANAPEEANFRTFFQEIPSGQFVPRSIFVDLEPSVIDCIRVGSFGRIFHPDLLVEGMEDSGSNYARARNSRGPHMIPTLMDKIRYVVESCDSLQGFMIFSSYGGGTGSGLGALILKRLELEFHRRPRIHAGIFPSPQLSPVVVDPYNSILFAADVLEHSDFSLLLDNSALYNIMKTSLCIGRPNYAHLNRISAQIISHLTSSLRFPNTLNNSLHEMQVNLIPYPKIKFPVSSFAPMNSFDRAYHDVQSSETLTSSVFHKSNLMVSCDLMKGLFMANSLIYRGPFDAASVHQAISIAKRNTNWVNWSPTGFKIGLSQQKPTFLNNSFLAPAEKSVFMVSNSTAIRTPIQRLQRKFSVMFAKQAFIHHYLNEGLEVDDLRLAHEEIVNLGTLYEEIQEVDFEGTIFDEKTTDHFTSASERCPDESDDVSEIRKRSVKPVQAAQIARQLTPQREKRKNDHRLDSPLGSQCNANSFVGDVDPDFYHRHFAERCSKSAVSKKRTWFPKMMKSVFN